MAKQKHLDRPIDKNLSLPTTLVTKVELQLFSPIEGRVPHGEWSRLVQQLLREWLKSRGVEA